MPRKYLHFTESQKQKLDPRPLHVSLSDSYLGTSSDFNKTVRSIFFELVEHKPISLITEEQKKEVPPKFILLHSL